jgi:hypothetical protein
VLTERPKDDAGELSVSPGEDKNLWKQATKTKEEPIQSTRAVSGVRETTSMKRLIAIAVFGIAALLGPMPGLAQTILEGLKGDMGETEERDGG